MSFSAVALAVVVFSFSALAGTENTPPRTHFCLVSPGQAYEPVVTPAPMPDSPFQPSGTGMLIPLARSVA
ncbi:hypothetical protein EES39_26970 [Streptomyces sp. ADI92-24]|nr:hypothetical protein EES39_26970 [Streptomyces sp. ADI92-24]